MDYLNDFFSHLVVDGGESDTQTDDTLSGGVSDDTLPSMDANLLPLDDLEIIPFKKGELNLSGNN